MASQPFIGSIFMFAGNFAPRGYALCQGQLLSISQNAALFSILGTTYGGNGTTTFGLPDLQGRSPVGQGNGRGLSPTVLGESAGAQSVSILTNNMPLHSHSLNANNQAAIGSDPTGTVLANSGNQQGGGGFPIYVSGAPNVQMNQQSIGATGGNVPLNVQNPFLCVNFIIALVGIFPSRS